MVEYRDPEYLSDEDHPTDRVRCPIHGFIRYSANERAVIDSRYFRRLRHIRQLGLTEYAYPGANHTRFEHSLGVMEMATAMFDSLAAKKGEMIEEELAQLPWYVVNTLAKARQVVRLAALLHDTGHAPFSHAAEKVFHKEGHETLSVKIVLDPSMLGTLIDETWGGGTATQVASLLKTDKAGSDLPPQLLFLKSIISGEIDADRTDYLLRDSYHCGVEYGRFDHRRLIECLTLRKVPGGGLEVAISRDGIHTVEALIMARFQMNAQVYFHRIRRIYDYFLIEYHKALVEAKAVPSEDVLDLNDVVMMNLMFSDAKSEEEGPRKFFASRIVDRRHPKIVHETGDDADIKSLREAQRIANALINKYTDVYIVLDDMGGKPITIHKIYVDGDQSNEAVELVVFGKDGTEKQVGEESRILSRIPKSFMCVRIFADADSEEHRLEIEAYVAELRMR
ncbi:MAG: HD domain-containing protein [Fimbriimonadaceae bacterium]